MQLHEQIIRDQGEEIARLTAKINHLRMEIETLESNVVKTLRRQLKESRLETETIKALLARNIE